MPQQHIGISKNLGSATHVPQNCSRTWIYMPIARDSRYLQIILFDLSGMIYIYIYVCIYVYVCNDRWQAQPFPTALFLFLFASSHGPHRPPRLWRSSSPERAQEPAEDDENHDDHDVQKSITFITHGMDMIPSKIYSNVEETFSAGCLGASFMAS